MKGEGQALWFMESTLPHFLFIPFIITINFPDRLSSAPPHWTPRPAHYFENYFLGCMFLQSLSREAYQEREFNVQEGSSVRGWECSCLAKTFHCSRNGSEKTSWLPGTLHAAPRYYDPVTAFSPSCYSKPEVYLSPFPFLTQSLHPSFSESLV